MKFSVIFLSFSIDINLCFDQVLKNFKIQFMIKTWKFTNYVLLILCLFYNLFWINYSYQTQVLNVHDTWLQYHFLGCPKSLLLSGTQVVILFIIFPSVCQTCPAQCPSNPFYLYYFLNIWFIVGSIYLN